MRKSIVVALVGAPNAGKSTLINKLVNQKISIVTSKCQTTRFNTRGVVNDGDTQIVFIDTPGLFQPSRELERGIVKQARSGLEEADLLCVTIDASVGAKFDVVDKLQHVNKPKILLLNKVDLVKNKSDLLKIAGEMYSSNFDAVFMISGRKGTGLKDVIRHIKSSAIEGWWYFEDDVASDITDRRLAEEITREILYYSLGAELPYALEVQTEAWDERNDGSVKINQIIHILKNSQKKIILGANGAKLKDMGQRSRIEISKVLEKPVHLFLYVKVKPDWVERRTSVDMRSDI